MLRNDVRWVAMTSYSIDRDIGLADFFDRAELAFIGLIGAVFCTDILMTLTGDQVLAWDRLAASLTAALGLVFGGVYMRVVKGAERGAKSAVVIGLTTVFALFMLVFFSPHMPTPDPALSDSLSAMDRWLGYDWSMLSAWVADVPHLGEVLQVFYWSAFLQVVAVVGILSYLSRFRDVDRMVFANAIGLLLVFLMWQVFPNLSQSTYQTVPAETARETDLMSGSVYFQSLIEMAANSLPMGQLDRMLGQVSFPSYQIVICVLAVWFSRATILFWPIVVINLIVVPAVLIHGSHHVADLIGGVAIAAIAVGIADVLFDQLFRSEPPQAI